MKPYKTTSDNKQTYEYKDVIHSKIKKIENTTKNQQKHEYTKYRICCNYCYCLQQLEKNGSVNLPKQGECTCRSLFQTISTKLNNVLDFLKECNTYFNQINENQVFKIHGNITPYETEDNASLNHLLNDKNNQLLALIQDIINTLIFVIQNIKLSKDMNSNNKSAINSGAKKGFENLLKQNIELKRQLESIQSKNNSQNSYEADALQRQLNSIIAILKECSDLFPNFSGPNINISNIYDLLRTDLFNLKKL